MFSGELFQKFLDRLAEVRIYREQGLDDGIGEMFGEMLAEIEKSPLSGPEKEELRLRIKSESRGLHLGPKRPEERSRTAATDPSQHFNYGRALMDGQFWEEAIAEFDAAAELGHEVLGCREYCGDCAARMEQWGDAIRFYNMVYADESISGELKRKVLLKISKCSQTQKKVAIDSVIQAKSSGSEASHKARPGHEVVTSSISSLDGYSVNAVLGQTVHSWAAPDAGPPSRPQHAYRIINLLHVGSSSLIVELEQQGSDKRFAGQSLTGRFGEILSPEKLAAWVCRQAATASRHLVRMSDLAHSDGHFFIVREYFPLSICDILSTGEVMPIPLCVRFAHQVLEALGDLHLHMGLDGKPRNSFHLDLRPSRVLLRTDQPCVKICNGGLWRELERAAPDETAVGKLPLHYLSYRAPEQFRPYLARKRPPVFTDIYLFGTLFYEMLTGIPAFKASSYAEYEIQHCEQYPSPPRVWRAEIPDVLNDIIMRCLESDPTKRFRSTTQMSLIIEKSFPDALARPKDDSYPKFLQKLKLI
ncbi:MAG: protein kinase [Syntrophobacteraceae bacterium]